MNFAPRYLGRGSWLARRDPRVPSWSRPLRLRGRSRSGTSGSWSLLLILALRLLPVGRDPVRRSSAATGPSRSSFVTIARARATRSSPAASPATADDRSTRLLHLPLLGTPISAESLSLRGRPSCCASGDDHDRLPDRVRDRPERPRRRLRAACGVPEKFAFGVDLTFRFIPSLAADFQTTIDAQRVRGYDLGEGERRPDRAPAPAGPVLVPLDDERDRGRRGHDRRDGPARVRDGPADVAARAPLRPTGPRRLLGFVALVRRRDAVAAFRPAPIWVPPFLIPG